MKQSAHGGSQGFQRFPLTPLSLYNKLFDILVRLPVASNNLLICYERIPFQKIIYITTNFSFY